MNELAVAAMLAICTTFNSGFEALAAKDYDTAIARFTEVIAARRPNEPLHVPARLARAQAYLDSGQVELALVDYAYVANHESAYHAIESRDRMDIEPLAIAWFVANGGNHHLIENTRISQFGELMYRRDLAALTPLMTPGMLARARADLSRADFQYDLHLVVATSNHWSSSNERNGVRTAEVKGEYGSISAHYQPTKGYFIIDEYALTAKSPEPRRQRMRENLRVFCAATAAAKTLLARQAALTPESLAEAMGDAGKPVWTPVDGGEPLPLIILPVMEPAAGKPRAILMAPQRPEGRLVLAYADGSSDIVESAEHDPTWAAFRDVRPPPDPAIGEWTAKLGHREAAVRGQARESLLAYGADALPALRELVHDDDPEIRISAQELIARIPERTAITEEEMDARVPATPVLKDDDSLFPKPFFSQRARPPMPKAEAQPMAVYFIRDYSAIISSMVAGLQHLEAGEPEKALPHFYAVHLDDSLYNNLYNWTTFAIATSADAAGDSDLVLAVLATASRPPTSLLNTKWLDAMFARHGGVIAMSMGQNEIFSNLRDALEKRDPAGLAAVWLAAAAPQEHPLMGSRVSGPVRSGSYYIDHAIVVVAPDSREQWVAYLTEQEHRPVIAALVKPGKRQVSGVEQPLFPALRTAHLEGIGRAYRRFALTGEETAAITIAALRPRLSSRLEVRTRELPRIPILVFPGADIAFHDQSGRILAAESDSTDGMRLVVCADGHVYPLSDADYQAAVKDLPTPITGTDAP